MNIKENVHLFDDNTPLHKTINIIGDAISLIYDSSKWKKWEEKRFMEFNKCKHHIISFKNKENQIVANYILHEEPLKHVNSVKYLGVESSNDMKWGKHIQGIVSKANKTSDFLRRNLKGCPILHATRPLCGLYWNGIAMSGIHIKQICMKNRISSKKIN